MAYKNAADRKAYARKHYEANKDIYKRRAAAHRRATRDRVTAMIRQAKARPCADCGVQYPFYVMQFDHQGSEKKLAIGTFARRNLTVGAVAAEISLCQVVCANCHARRTYLRGERYGSRITPADDTLF